jgi:putative oxidoreductase
MNYVQRLEHWGDTHHPKWIDLLRIILGIFLCFKGIEFANNMSSVLNLMTGQVPFSSFMVMILFHYIVFAHLLGGVLLALGMLTRFACIIQLPILLGAIFFINLSPEVMRPFSELFLSILVLLLLIYFLVVGSGPWSLDKVIQDSNKKDLA